jgi:hypothetical protein
MLKKTQKNPEGGKEDIKQEVGETEAKEVVNEVEEEATEVQEQEDIIIKPRLNKKTGKPLLSKEELNRIRMENLAKGRNKILEMQGVSKENNLTKKELERIKRDEKIKEKIKETEKLKKEIDELKPKEVEANEVPEVQEEVQEVEVKKKKEKKPKKIIEVSSDSSDSEEEVIVRRKKKPIKHYDEDEFINAVQNNAKETIKRQLHEERLKMAYKSICPSYKF